MKSDQDKSRITHAEVKEDSYDGLYIEITYETEGVTRWSEKWHPPDRVHLPKPVLEDVADTLIAQEVEKPW